MARLFETPEPTMDWKRRGNQFRIPPSIAPPVKLQQNALTSRLKPNRLIGIPITRNSACCSRGTQGLANCKPRRTRRVPQKKAPPLRESRKSPFGVSLSFLDTNYNQHILPGDFFGAPCCCSLPGGPSSNLLDLLHTLASKPAKHQGLPGCFAWTEMTNVTQRCTTKKLQNLVSRRFWFHSTSQKLFCCWVSAI